jgi:hypothetical protein
MKRARAVAVAPAPQQPYTVLFYVIPTRDVLCVPCASQETYMEIARVLEAMPPGARLSRLLQATDEQADDALGGAFDLTDPDTTVLPAGPDADPDSDRFIAMQARRLKTALRKALAPGHAWTWLNLLKSATTVRCNLVHVV